MSNFDAFPKQLTYQSHFSKQNDLICTRSRIQVVVKVEDIERPDFKNGSFVMNL